MEQGKLFGLTKSNFCVFCKIVKKEQHSFIVYEDNLVIAFLDDHPIFFGHVLVIPKQHFETITDLPSSLLSPFFQTVQFLAEAVQKSLNANGTFIGNNNKVSQSVPHFHVHIVPRRYKDGLRGFFWPRMKYKDENESIEIQEKIRSKLFEILKKKTKLSEGSD